MTSYNPFESEQDVRARNRARIVATLFLVFLFHMMWLILPTVLFNWLVIFSLAWLMYLVYDVYTS